MYKLIALLGKAGSGKDTILNRICESDKFHKIISCTTRPIRENEENGKDYIYLTNEEFSQKVLNDELIEATIFNNWCYGTPIDSLDKNKINIGIFNLDGLFILENNKDIDLIIYYITCSQKERLLRQLKREDNPNVEEILRRFKTDEIDFLRVEELETPYIELKNETIQDIDKITSQIFTEIK